MARTRTFDQKAVAADAMAVFWHKGFEATSVDDLVQATGINRASMYATFGSKEGLLLAALDHYVASVNRERLRLLEGADSVRAGLDDYFDALIAFSLGDGRGLGCLLTNTAIELSPHNPGIRRKLEAIFGEVESAFRRLFERGRASGELAADTDPQALSYFFLTTIQGLRVMARSNADPRILRQTVATAMKALH